MALLFKGNLERNVVPSKTGTVEKSVSEGGRKAEDGEPLAGLAGGREWPTEDT